MLTWYEISTNLKGQPTYQTPQNLFGLFAAANADASLTRLAVPKYHRQRIPLMGKMSVYGADLPQFSDAAVQNVTEVGRGGWAFMPLTTGTRVMAASPLNDSACVIMAVARKRASVFHTPPGGLNVITINSMYQALGSPDPTTVYAIYAHPDRGRSFDADFWAGARDLAQISLGGSKGPIPDTNIFYMPYLSENDKAFGITQDGNIGVITVKPEPAPQ